jgi:hypothetical protein
MKWIKNMQGTHIKKTLFSLINSSLAKHGLKLLKVQPSHVNWATQPSPKPVWALFKKKKHWAFTLKKVVALVEKQRAMGTFSPLILKKSFGEPKP